MSQQETKKRKRIAGVLENALDQLKRVLTEDRMEEKARELVESPDTETNRLVYEFTKKIESEWKSRLETEETFHALTDGGRRPV